MRSRAKNLQLMYLAYFFIYLLLYPLSAYVPSASETHGLWIISSVVTPHYAALFLIKCTKASFCFSIISSRVGSQSYLSAWAYWPFLRPWKIFSVSPNLNSLKSTQQASVIFRQGCPWNPMFQLNHLRLWRISKTHPVVLCHMDLLFLLQNIRSAPKALFGTCFTSADRRQTLHKTAPYL